MSEELSVASLDVFEVVEILKKSGAKGATVERVRAHIEAGCPVNDDGTMNLIVYCAWLTKAGRRD